MEIVLKRAIYAFLRKLIFRLENNVDILKEKNISFSKPYSFIKILPIQPILAIVRRKYIFSESSFFSLSEYHNYFLNKQNSS